MAKDDPSTDDPHVTPGQSPHGSCLAFAHTTQLVPLSESNKNSNTVKSCGPKAWNFPTCCVTASTTTGEVPMPITTSTKNASRIVRN